MLPIPRGTEARLGEWIWNGWVLQAGVCVKLYVACAVCSVRGAHDAGHGRAEHMCSRGEPLKMRGLLWKAQGDVMAARMVGIRQEGESLPDGTVQEGRGVRSASSCHDVTQKVRSCELPRWCAGCELPRWCCAMKKKKKRAKQASLRVNRIPEAGVKDPLTLGIG